MSLPFTVEQFFGVFERYNLAVWPAPVGLYALALGAVGAAAGRRFHSDRLVAAALAILWAWMAVAYHWLHFAAINPAAWLFGGLFLVQALLFAWGGVVRADLAFGATSSARTAIAGALVLYALVGYPLLGAALGHVYPAAPTFGAPCPTVIFTIGVLVLLHRPPPVYLLLVPVLWAAVGASAAFALGVYEDLGLLVAGVLGAGLALDARRHARRPAVPA